MAGFRSAFHIFLFVLVREFTFCVGAGRDAPQTTQPNMALQLSCFSQPAWSPSVNTTDHITEMS